MVFIVLEIGYNRNPDKQGPSYDHFKFLGPKPPFTIESIFGVFKMEMYFNGKYDGPSIDKYITHHKLVYGKYRRLKVKDY